MMEDSKDKALLKKELDETWALNSTHILIWHKEFINKFILDNYFYFDFESGNEESTKDIAELINKTAFYVNRKINNKILEATFAINGNKPNRHITQLQSRNKDRLAKIKDDLLSLSVYGGKTQTIVEHANGAGVWGVWGGTQYHAGILSGSWCGSNFADTLSRRPEQVAHLQ